MTEGYMEHYIGLLIVEIKLLWDNFLIVGIRWVWNNLGNLGVIFAVRAYFRWKSDHRLKIADEYARNLLKRVKKLHYEIEQLRSPIKFIKEKSLITDIEYYISKFDDIIKNTFFEIRVDLLDAEYNLINNENIVSNFHEKIGIGVIGKIYGAIYIFNRAKQQANFKVRETDLFKIFFPAELNVNSKKSDLGPNLEVIDDDFNKLIEKNFSEIYRALEANLAVGGYTKQETKSIIQQVKDSLSKLRMVCLKMLKFFFMLFGDGFQAKSIFFFWSFFDTSGCLFIAN